ncbi:TetR/AcrR family transcriptional regulator [Streptomyces sp. NPDC101455]|uniref:TetR/AcrR family transcriptional regulator n=1 Tax=Streptomyces sp. NPDC101455 TaxID=3366142 RepID=UPI0037F169E4
MATTAPGRKRSETARLAILDAARELVAADGYENLTIEGIASRAGVGKVTIYRWWPSKGLVLAEALLDRAPVINTRPPAVTGRIADDLRNWLHDWVRVLASPEGSSQIRALTSAASDDQAVAVRLYEAFTAPLHTMIVQRLGHAAQIGEIRSDADLESAADAVVGSLLYRMLTRTEEVTTQRADGLLDLLLHGLTPHSRRSEDPQETADR